MQSLVVLMLMLMSLTVVWCHSNHEHEGSCEEFDIVREELIARWGVATPSGTDAVHEPVLTLRNNRVAKVTIGRNGTHHPQMGGTNTKKIHFIEYMYVVDQSNRIIAFKRFIPENRDVWENTELSFELEGGVTTLQAFSYCNRHGLFASEIEEVDSDGNGHYKCDQLSCSRTTCALLDTLKTEAFRKVGGPDAAKPLLLNITLDTVGVTVHGISSLPEIAYADCIFFLNRKTQSPIAGSVLNGLPERHSQMIPHHTIDTVGKVDLFILYYSRDGQPVLVKNTKSFLPSSTCAPEEGGPCAAQYRLGLVSGSHKDKCFSEADVIKANALRVPTSGSESSHIPMVQISDNNIVTAIVDHSFNWNNDPSHLHYIDFMWAEDENHVIIAMESWVNNLTFALPIGVRKIQVFSSCNRHGVHSSNVIDVPMAANATFGSTLRQNTDLSDVLSYCKPTSEQPFSYFGGEHLCGDQILKMLHADGVAFNSIAFPNRKPSSELPAVITPSLEFGSFGEGNAIVRFPAQERCLNTTSVGSYSIRNVVVVDQHKNVVAGTRYVGVERNPQLVFVVPKGATTLTVRVAYNEFGLWVAQPQQVGSTCSIDLGYGCSIHTIINSTTESEVGDDDDQIDEDDDDDDDNNQGTQCVRSNIPKYSCMTVSDVASIHWNLSNSELALALQIHKTISGYVAFAFPERNGKMAPADSLIASSPTSELFGYRVLEDPDRVIKDDDLFSRNKITDSAISVVDGKVLLELVRSVSDDFDASKVFINVAWSDNNINIQSHHDQRFTYSFDFVNESVQSEKSEIYYYLHSVLMMLGFGIFIPIGVISKYRMRKEVTPKPQTAVYTHAVNVLIGVLCVDVGFFMKAGFSNHKNNVGGHETIGFLVFFLVNAMPLFVCFSNFPFVDGEKTPFRESIGLLHRYMGRVVVVLALFQCLTGAIQMRDISPPTSVLIGIVIGLSVAVMFFMSVLPTIKGYNPIKPQGDAELETKHQINDFATAVDNVEADDQEIENA